MFIEITTRSFDVEFIAGDMLNQMRLVYNNNIYLNDKDLVKINKTKKLCFSNKKAIFENGLKLTIDLSNDKTICAYRSKINAPLVYFSKNKYHKHKKYWEPIKPKNKSLIIKKNNFYILNINI